MTDKVNVDYMYNDDLAIENAFNNELEREPFVKSKSGSINKHDEPDEVDSEAKIHQMSK